MNSKKVDNNEEETFIEFLNSKRMRKTPERFEILRCALQCNRHFDADALHKNLDEKGYHVSKATVYNTLELLAEAGIIRKLLFDTHQARFEIADTSHSHLICQKCGTIIEIPSSEFGPNIDTERLQGFEVRYVSTCIYGICNKCNSDKVKKQI